MEHEFDVDMLDFDGIDSSSDSEEGNAVPKRYVRDMENPFEKHTNEEFNRRYKCHIVIAYHCDILKSIYKYRFSKEAVRNVLIPIIRDDVTKPNRRGLPITPEIQMLLFLRFLATASFQV